VNRHTRTLAAAAALLAVAGCTHAPARPAPTAAPAGPAPSVSVGPVVAAPRDVLRDGPVFGVHPVTIDQVTNDTIAAATGCRPGWTERFANVAGGVTVDQLTATPGVPLLSLEPWEDRKVHDPRWTLTSTITGQHDDQYRRVAAAVRAYSRPLLLRFAHEMNGAWYPWGPVDGQTPEQYRQAWAHVVALFYQAGATNALWVWSPNIVRGAVNTPLREFYPGDELVDFIGVTGYGENESTLDSTYKTTLTQLTALTSKQIILTEIGARPNSLKTGWIRSFGPWLAAHPQVVGFVWSLHPAGNGARYDWRYDDTPTNLAAFKSSLTQGHVAC
jgi:hypothetical protein